MTQVIEESIVITPESVSQKTSLLLANKTQLSQGKIKEAMQKGAVWLTRGESKKRLRRADKALNVGDKIDLHYNSQILNQATPDPHLLYDAGDYTIWYKPFGLACQGSRWGDFASISRWVESHLENLSNKPQRNTFLVHRLDRATTGLMLLCHTKNAARLFSQKFANGEVDKRYQAIVKGDFSSFPEEYKVESLLAGKNSISYFTCLDYHKGYSLLDVKLLTGRKHQIRKHLSELGFPIVGDRLYGDETFYSQDLQLQSVSLKFICPLKNMEMSFYIDKNLKLNLKRYLYNS